MTANSYSKTLVSYIDILGFAEMIERSRKEPAEIEMLWNRLSELRRVAEESWLLDRNARNQLGEIFDSFSFSDHTVRCTRIPDGSPLAVFVLAELHYLSQRQSALAAQGVLMRGGVCIGDLFIDRRKAIVFGPALVRAYQLESTHAIYPRIVIDNAVIFEVGKVSSRTILDDFVGRGEEGTYFLDYLFGAPKQQCLFYGDTDKMKALLRDHRQMIETAIRDNPQTQDERLKQKYRWLARYHNSAVRRLAERIGTQHLGNTSELFISPADLDL